MIDWRSYLPGLGNDDEEDPVSRTLRTLQQGASDVGAGISSGLSSAGTAITEGLGSAVQAAQPYVNPTPNWTPEEQAAEAEIERGRGIIRAGVAAAPGAALTAAQEAYEDPLTSSMPAVPRAGRIISEAGSAAGSSVVGAMGEAAGGTGPAFTTPEVETPLGTIPSFSPTPRDIGGAVGSVVGDPTSWVLPGGAADKAADLALRNLARPVAAPVGRALGAGARAVGSVVGDAAEGLTGALARNADNVAAADARMAEAGSTQLPGALGVAMGTDAQSMVRPRIVPPDVARELPGGMRLPNDPVLAEAVRNTPGVRLTPEGVEIDAQRFQRERDAGRAPSSGGVFYGIDNGQGRSPYRIEAEDPNYPPMYGGSQEIKGPTLVQRPFVETSENTRETLEQLAGEAGRTPDEASEMVSDFMALGRRDFSEDAYNALARRYGVPEMPPGRGAPELRVYEGLRAALARQADYDAVIRVSQLRRHGANGVTLDPPKVSEFHELREGTYPTPEGGFTLRPEFRPGRVPTNAERVAAADARMAAEGSTLAPAGLGALPEPSGARRGLPTVEVLQERLDAATAAWQRAREAGDDQMAAIARERAVELQGALVDARNARLDLEPAIRSDVGRRVESLPLAEETADTLSGAGSRRAEVDDLSGRVSMPTDLRGRMNVSAGAAPDSQLATRGAGALPAVNRVLSEGIAGGVGGAVIEQGRNPDEDPRTAAARGFAAGALGFPAATRLARGAARLAGAGADEAGGAAATIGAVPTRRAAAAAASGTPAAPAPADLSSVLAKLPGFKGAIEGADARRAALKATGERGPSVWDWMKQFGYAGIYGPQTFANSAIGGAQELLLGQPKEAIRALVEGRPVASRAAARRQVAAAGEGLAGLGRVLLGSDADTAAKASGGSQGTAGLSERVANPAGHLLARLLERPGEVLTEAPDALLRPAFITQGEEREAARIAKEMGFTGDKAASFADTLLQSAQDLKANPNARSTSAEARRVMEAGRAYADELGYKGEPGGFGTWLSKLAKRDDGIGVAATFLMPFPSMAARMTTAAARSTPGVGLLPQARAGRPLKGFDTVYDQAFGSLVASGVAAWAMQGGITGSGPDDPEKRAELLAMGWQPNAILIGDRYVPNRMAGRFQALLDGAGELHDAIAYKKKDASLTAIAADLAKRGSTVLTDQVGLSGLADVHDMFQQGLETQFPGFAARALVRHIPGGGILRAIATGLDPMARKADKGSFTQALATAIPGLRQGVPVAQDVLGRPQENPQWGPGALVPKATLAKDDPVVGAFLDAGADISRPPDEVNGVKLTPAQQRRYQQVRGQEIQRLAGPTITAGSWASTPPETQKILLNTYLRVSKTLADAAVATEGGAAFNEARTKAIVDRASGK